MGVNACCDVVNRGLAAWNGKLFLGTLDGRLIALDATTGKMVWETPTIDPIFRYTITGAPRVVKGKVIIGNGGGEFGVRGYVSAYDAETGKMIWRFYTVPGDPSKPFESPILQKAAKTWTGEWWKFGGGGTVWDSIVYDPELDLLYIGVGNGGPWNGKYRSPQGGDNLFTVPSSRSSRIRASTSGTIRKTRPTNGTSIRMSKSSWPTFPIAGQVRKVLLQAPKNGFFYVLDRASGELISAAALYLHQLGDGG